MSNDQEYLTKEKLEELKKELDYLKNTKRRDVAQRIQDAKELGDLSENAEYTEAKDDQAWTEGRIQELEQILKNAVVVEDCEQGDSTVRVGCRLKVKPFDSPSTHSKDSGQAGSGSLRASASLRELEIVGSQEADPANGKISNESPLGTAFLGKKAGDEVSVEIPKGRVKYKIISVN